MLLVDLTASWCGPCQVMDRTTWRDTAVVSWVHQHAIALKIDVQHHPEKERFRSPSLPTVIALRGGEEIDRVLGLHDPKQMLAWLEGLARGVTSLDVARARVAEAPLDVRARWRLIQRLCSDEASDEGLGHLLWFWQHALEHAPAFVGVRGSHAVALIERLCKASPRAFDAFDAVRQIEGDLTSPAADVDRVSDYLDLSIALGRDSDVAVWAAEVADEVIEHRRLHSVLALRVEPFFEGRGRYDLIACIHRRPGLVLKQETEALARIRELPAEMLAAMVDMEASTGRHGALRVMRVVHALEAVGREADARSLRDSLAASSLGRFVADRGE